MKDARYTDLICGRFCRYFKEGTEELHCGTYHFLKNTLTPDELQTALDLLHIERLTEPPASTKDADIEGLVCARCDFRIDGCDFRESGRELPCGGYVIIERLLS